MAGHHPPQPGELEFLRGLSSAGTDDAHAASLYRAAAQLGHVEAQVKLGDCLHTGVGVRRDDSEAVLWYRCAADQGHAEAQAHLGWLLYLGLGVEKDNAEAARWSRQAAALGSARGALNYGFLLSTGEGVERRDEAAAEKYYHAAAQRGLPQAQFILGKRLASSHAADTRSEGARWLGLAAKAGEPNALAELETHVADPAVVRLVCVGCGQVDGLQPCSECGVAHYCSRPCLSRVWTAHRASCREWRLHPPSGNTKAGSTVSPTKPASALDTPSRLDAGAAQLTTRHLALHDARAAASPGGDAADGKPSAGSAVQRHKPHHHRSRQQPT